MERGVDLTELETLRGELADRLTSMPRNPLPGNPGPQHAEALARAARATLSAEIAVLDKVINDARTKPGAPETAGSDFTKNEELSSLLEAVNKVGDVGVTMVGYADRQELSWHATPVEDPIGGAVIGAAAVFDLVSRTLRGPMDGNELARFANSVLGIAEKTGISVIDTLRDVGQALSDQVKQIPDLIDAIVRDDYSDRSDDARQKAAEGAEKIESRAAQMQETSQDFAEKRTQDKKLIAERVGKQLEMLAQDAIDAIASVTDIMRTELALEAPSLDLKPERTQEIWRQPQ
ncbi:hypothetical protein ACQI5H_23765 [Mycobacterium heidelbergense]|uniref:hypothetical protein n=1 Tax=Mycobacterium heidelbergense TaxID=53376 RepID=UPI003CF1BAFF